MDHARRSLVRLGSPGLVWLTGGLTVVLLAVVLLVVAEPVQISTTPWTWSGDQLRSALTWVGGVSAGLLSIGAVVYGLVALRAEDRQTLAPVLEVAPAPVGFVQRLVGFGFGALACSMIGAGLIVAELVMRDSTSPMLIGPYVLGAATLVLGALCLGGAVLVAVLGDHPSPISVGPPVAMRPSIARPIPGLHLGLLLLLAFVAVGLQLTLVNWFIEDSAISFAYARNLAMGEGLVTYPGGERVEGYSNPLWTFLLAAIYLVGVDAFVSSKVLALSFGAVTMPVTYLIAREARPHRGGLTPLLAVLMVAGSAQFVIWGASGLENGLLNLLVALAIWRTLVEARRGGIPWSALLYFGVAVTRPEALLYAALGGFAAMVFRAQRVGPELFQGGNPGKVRRTLWAATWPTIAWLTIFFVPFLGYHAWRYDYFSWLAPNTYYAKKANPGKRFAPYEWDRGGWRYVRDYGYKLWQTWFLPAYLLGLLGSRGLRLAVGGVTMLAMLVVFALPGWGAFDGELFAAPEWWDSMRPWVLLGAIVLPIPFAVGRPGWRALTLCWGTAGIALFFAVYAGGDWMKGFRWMSSLVVPASVVLAVGVGELADLCGHWLDRQSKWFGVGLAVVASAVVGLLVWSVVVTPFGLVMPMKWRFGEPELVMLVVAPLLLVGAVALGFTGRASTADRRTWGRTLRTPWGPAAWVVVTLAMLLVSLPAAHSLHRNIKVPVTTPHKVKKRVNYMSYVQRRLHMQHRPVILDVDMGANMYWSDDAIVDVAGLVDVSMGHHWFERAFVREYVFDERKPDFAHVHGSWARASKMATMLPWTREYMEIPGYPAGKRALHPGNFIRKDLLSMPLWTGSPGRRVALSTGMILEGWEAPAPSATPGQSLFLEVALRVTRTRADWEDVRVLAFLSGPDGVVSSWDVPPGYDWYSPGDWGDDEVVFSRYTLPVSSDVPVGTYDLGFVVMGTHEGAVLRPIDVAAVPDGAVFGGRDGVAAHMANGEVRWLDTIEIVSEAELTRRSTADLSAALLAAEQGRCEAARASFWTAERRMSRTGWFELNRPVVAAPLAACWTAQSKQRDGAQRLALLIEARAWDHRERSTVHAGANLADELVAVGMAARDEADWEVAYPAFRDALKVAPWLSAVRVLAEEARDCRLRIHNRSCAVVPDSPRIGWEPEDTGEEFFELEPQVPSNAPSPSSDVPGIMPLAVPVQGEQTRGED